MKEINKKKSIITIGLITVLLCTIGATYAYFTARVEKQGDNTVDVKTEALANATMEMGNKIEASGVLPGYKVVKTVRVTGSGPENAKPVNAVISLIPNVTEFSNHIEYEVYALDNPNEIDANNICSESNKHIDNNQYYDEMTCDTTNLGEKITNGVFNKIEPVGIDIEVGSKTDKTYYILVKYVNDEENPQDSEQGKRFTIDIDFSTEIKETTNLSKVVQLGDYIKMTPTSTSYTIEGSKTGCSENATKCNNQSNQTINPSELDTWRVINKKEDGTIEVVSEYTSNENIYFYGKTGYLNYIDVLNEIASSYENEKYSIGSRYLGYNGQTKIITDISLLNYPPVITTNTSIHGNQYESQGGGDILYQKDIDLVVKILGNLSANKQEKMELSSYYVCSRFFNATENTIGLRVRIAHEALDDSIILYQQKSIDNIINMPYDESAALRPIVILKSNIINVEGSGTSESPWVLN